MAGKRLHLARLMMATGIPGLVARNASTSLLVLNYHRIRAPGQMSSEFDDGVFDADFDTFRRQMEWLKSATEIVGETDLLELQAVRATRRGRLHTLVTFDDGYIDCFTLVKPVLDDLGIRGIFFIPIEILESRCLGWWDLAAYVLKKCRLGSIRLEGRELPLGVSLPLTLRHVLSQFKLEKAERTEDLLARLSSACDVPLPDKDRQSIELMDWDQVCKLREAGHAIGSHAWSHRALATLPPAEQAREIRESKRELQAIVGAEVRSFAYPVGGPLHYDAHSVECVREAGYSQAFTFNTGLCGLPISDRFQIPRESAKSLLTLKAKALLPRFMGLKSPRVVSR